MNKRAKLRRIAEKVTRREFICWGSFTSAWAFSGNGRPREVWVDQDGGWEDIVAVAILLRSPDVKVMGIATTPGIAKPAVATSRVRQLLAALGERDVAQVTTFPKGADVLATGPLSRVAKLIAAKTPPSSVTWMGGAIGVPGNAKFGAEWNAASDGKALQAVLSSDVPLTMCPLDLTNQFPSQASWIAESPRPILKQIRTAYVEPNRSMWDELAAASIAVPDLFERREVRLVADAHGKITVQDSGKAVSVLVQCDRAGFEGLVSRSMRF